MDDSLHCVQAGGADPDCFGSVSDYCMGISISGLEPKFDIWISGSINNPSSYDCVVDVYLTVGTVVSQTMAEDMGKQRLRPFLEAQINGGRIQGLCWLNSEKTKFRIPWCHGGKPEWKPERGQIFKVIFNQLVLSEDVCIVTCL